ncbi:MAG: hypothetical protein QOJ65_116 [Fimbriimonadaceae bacterium]|jgi:predicted dithiol-disulfide oxidoreductase (DUF899 family)|nr:hypothetical protein [Fimbriimonadaceae bacterium]
MAVETKTEIEKLQEEIEQKKKQLAELRRAQPAQPVEDYTFDTPHGEVRLSELFNGRTDLLIIHNMGESCRYCMLWADGLNGVLPHLENRTSVVMVNPDPVDQQQRFALSRGWKFHIVRDTSGDFSKAMGMHGQEAGSFWPGATGLTKEADGTIRRVASAPFGEGDDFCATWHLLDLLADGWNKWEPQYTY